MKNVYRVVAILGLLASVCISSPVQDKEKEKETITAKGIVTNPATGDPVPKATVTFGAASGSRTPLYTATSGEDGRFAVERVVPGKYRVNVERAGFITPHGFSEEEDIPTSGRIMTLADGSVPANLIRLPLIRAASVSGRVLDEQGAPLTLTEVSLYEKKYSYWSGRRTLEVVMGPEVRLARPTNNGEYEVTGLRPGEYFIRVVGSYQPKGDPLSIPLTFYPGVTGLERAVPITLTEGMALGGMNIRVIPSPLFSIRLRLQSASDVRPSFGVQVTGSNGLSLENLKTDEQGDGVYILRNIPAGEYDIDVHFRPPNPLQPYSHRIHVLVVDRDADLKTVNVDSQVSISGHVQVPLGTMLPRDVILMTVDGGPFFAAPVAEDGTFRFEKVSLGEYTVDVPQGQGQYVRAVRNSARDVPGSFVIDDPSPGPLEIVIDRDTAKVEGTVQDFRNDAVAFGRVVLIPDASRRTNPKLFLTAISDEKGRFYIENAPPGKYGVLAWRNTPPYAYKNVEFLEPFLTRANPVELHGGLTSSLNIRVIEPK